MDWRTRLTFSLEADLKNGASNGLENYNTGNAVFRTFDVFLYRV